jgi:hypothetical protein
MAATNYSVPAFGGRTYPLWSNEGLLIMFLLHMGPTEAVYYWAHRALHHHYLYNRYHSHHHSLFITEANSGKEAYTQSMWKKRLYDVKPSVHARHNITQRHAWALRI